MPESQPLRVALLGAGRIGSGVFAPLLTSMPGVTLCAIADADAGACARVRRLAPEASEHRDWRSLAGLPRPDAAIVALPSAVHAEAAALLLRNHIPVYIEKPFATTMDGARDILDAYEGHGVTAMVGFNYRVNPLYEQLRQRVRAGAIGPIRFIRTIFTSPRRVTDGWRLSSATGGGVLFDLASHHMDLVRFLSGQEICHVDALARAAGGEGGDRAAVTLRLTGDVIVSSTFANGAVDDDRVEVFGELGALSVDRYRSLAVVERGPEVPGRLSGLAHAASAIPHLPYLFRKVREPWHEPSFRIALRRFVAAVRAGQPVAPDPYDGWASLAAVLAAQRSAVEGRRIPVEPTPSASDRGVAHAR